MPPRATRNANTNKDVYNQNGQKRAKTGEEISALQAELIQSYLKQVKTQNLTLSSVELELKFGTRITPITQIQSMNVISFLHSRGFKQEMEYLLRINCDISQDRSQRRSIRAEISSLNRIQEYCTTSVLNKDSDTVKYVTKSGNTDLGFYNIDVDDFNYRMSLNDENVPPTDDIDYLHREWAKLPKYYRLIHRTTMKHPLLPYIIDVSTVKQSKQDTRDFVDVFKMSEQYEIEIECDNTKFSVENFKSSDVLTDLGRIVKYVHSGIQNTNYPIKLSEQYDVLNTYSELTNGSARSQAQSAQSAQHAQRPRPRFIGPQSVSLELKNISTETIVGTPNIRDNYCVTDKADGDRKLMYINDVGKIYLINTIFEVQYTGLFTKNTTSYNSILDGEHILLDKMNKFINWFSAFDIYFINNKNVSNLNFDSINISTAGELRLHLMEKFIEDLHPQLFIPSNNKDVLKIKVKTFTIGQSSRGRGGNYNIFEGCNKIWNTMRHDNNVIPYMIDGLIFTPINTPVPKTKTWNESLKWKPANMNSIDFMVTVKQSNGIEDVKIKYLNSNISADNIIRYKVLELRVGYSSSDHDNDPQQIVNDGRFNRRNINDRVDDYKPVQFFPTSPPDNDAGICHIAINRRDDKMYTENKEVIENNTIVEFRYDTESAGVDKQFRWIPMRVRYDKTKKLRNGENMYGNDFTVANNIWSIIHNPITEDMINTGNNIPSIDSDVYYNANYSKNTINLRQFHNRFVKQSLIQSISRERDTLIDLAVGKGGDIPKWIESKLKFVLGIDLSYDNIHNKKDGACARLIGIHQTSRGIPETLFVVGDSGIDLFSENNGISDTDRITINTIFGRNRVRDTDNLPAVVNNNRVIARDGFNICSVQFALHYMFKSETVLDSFIRNVAAVTKLNGFFIGTCWDGSTVFNLLKDLKKGEIYNITTESQSTQDNIVLCQITKQYDSVTFENDMTSIGMPVDIKQDSINNIREYLVNFKLFVKLMSTYGFELAEKTDLNMNSKIEHTSGMFKELYMSDYNYGTPLTQAEKNISFLNRFFIFKKIREAPDASIITKIRPTSKTYIENTTTRLPMPTLIQPEPLPEKMPEPLPEKLPEPLPEKMPENITKPATIFSEDVPQLQPVPVKSIKPKTIKPKTIKPKTIKPTSVQIQPVQPVQSLQSVQPVPEEKKKTIKRTVTLKKKPT